MELEDRFSSYSLLYCAGTVISLDRMRVRAHSGKAGGGLMMRWHGTVKRMAIHFIVFLS